MSVLEDTRDARPDHTPPGHNSYGVDTIQFMDFVDRLEDRRAAAKEVADEVKEIMKEAKSVGYNTKILNSVLGMRAMDQDKLTETEAVRDLYMGAAGLLGPSGHL